MNGLGLGSEETREAHGARAAVTRPRPRPRVHRQPLRQKEPYFLGTFLPSAQTNPREQQPSPRPLDSASGWLSVAQPQRLFEIPREATSPTLLLVANYTCVD